jgi:hypothetical protein
VYPSSYKVKMSSTDKPSVGCTLNFQFMTSLSRTELFKICPRLNRVEL